MIEQATPTDPRQLAPVRGGEDPKGIWTERLVQYLRVMAAVSMISGLKYWASICGFAFVPEGGFEAQPIAWQTATIFFAVINLVAAVGLWLAAPWGAVVWLTSAVSMIVVEVFFPQIYDDLLVVLVFHPVAIIAYLVLAVLAAREQPH
ncbi:MAG TPA: DUF6163 family protein [Xanthobacteraceae bacterium]|nr:DUF6163 family protein [Xanthobacteraceae bacterium]